VGFLRGWKLWHERIGVLAKIEIFLGIFGGFLGCLKWLGPNHNYFSEIEGPAVIFPNAQGPW
jgi:hypothetical protein